MTSLNDLLNSLIEKLPECSRDVLKQYAMTVIVYSKAKMVHKQTPNSERIQWARVLVSAIGSGEAILRDSELDELTVRIEKLEKGG